MPIRYSKVFRISFGVLFSFPSLTHSCTHTFIIPTGLNFVPMVGVLDMSSVGCSLGKWTGSHFHFKSISTVTVEGSDSNSEADSDRTVKWLWTQNGTHYVSFPSGSSFQMNVAVIAAGKFMAADSLWLWTAVTQEAVHTAFCVFFARKPPQLCSCYYGFCSRGKTIC